ncbi:DNA polymerase III subunit delta' [Paenactinomyces guangxiensis]|uniref:DNA polymerase III subunit delta' n=1 Tax=Paenactinomyces guangxiensis TaxID=1490290 RepID=A0A7W1WSJ5_9BACL|nr:DNA polymerase III subunit delta' [Paenactinomyces guangxiensis]MBA4495278.1 DNA polymerase III subunit delta' [Paenactinomyces guangxiensis]MBH8592362.1 DNA polymerase III subunit delta' [Paenactinomyces guangxiensis]
MSFGQIESQPQAIHFLQMALAEDKIAHAYCFYGPGGSDKKQAALELAKALNCETKKNDACDQCRSCRQIEHGNHPDVITIVPDGAFIKIDQVRSLQQHFRYSAPQKVTRVVILEQAEKMRLEAANSLLKFLEEPVSPMVAILISENIQVILPTILSRCQKVRFVESSPSLKAKRLEYRGVPANTARILAHLPVETADLPQWHPEEIQALFRQVIEWSKQILTGRPVALTAIQSDWLRAEAEKQRLPVVLDLLLLWLRDLAQYSLNRTDYVFQDWRQDIEEQALKWKISRLLLGMDNVMIARRLLVKGNLQPQAVLEQMVLAMQEEKLSTENGWQLI